MKRDYILFMSKSMLVVAASAGCFSTLGVRGVTPVVRLSRLTKSPVLVVVPLANTHPCAHALPEHRCSCWSLQMSLADVTAKRVRMTFFVDKPVLDKMLARADSKVDNDRAPSLRRQMAMVCPGSGGSVEGWVGWSLRGAAARACRQIHCANPLHLLPFGPLQINMKLIGKDAPSAVAYARVQKTEYVSPAFPPPPPPPHPHPPSHPRSGHA